MNDMSKKEQTPNVFVIVPDRTVKTGEDISVTIEISDTKLLSANKDAVYYIVDWGDGTWSYRGPGLFSASKKSKPSVFHTYEAAGEYEVRAAVICLQDGVSFGWSDKKTVFVSGEDFIRRDMIKPAAVISSGAFSPEFKAENALTEDETYFKSKLAENPFEPLYIGVLFDRIYTLDRFDVQIPPECKSFPSDISVEYTTDNGVMWQDLPKYYYLYDYSRGRFDPYMNFPNPAGKTLSFRLDGITANGIRLISKRFADAPEKTLSVKSLCAYGDKTALFYTSKSDTYNADLNNMWTVFGTAKTEPQILGSLMGEIQNGSPFRTGSAMIGSTEWAEWTGLKFNFTDYKAVKDIYLDLLRRMRTGADGWSDDDGYVWATPDGQYHINNTFGAHYSLNPVYIIAVRNYLLQKNNISGFLELKNSSGQTVKEKTDKAMSYMMNTLDGKSGVMTIFDPAHNGTASGMSSNYWDVHRAFGYKSAYENALFYKAVIAYADIYEYLSQNAADCKSAKEYKGIADKYRAHADKVKACYNGLFWDDKKKRFIGGVNADGERLDFGYTFVNFMALAYGAADKDKASAIYSWLDGKRIIDSDTSKGGDIYGRFKYAARSNTLDVSKVKDKNGNYYWYDHGGLLPCTPDTFGGFGNQMQNGGTIFYISYYDLKARLDCLGADDAKKRFDVITEEFHKDSLRRNSYSEHGEYVEGVIGEFPESGLVPFFFVDGFLGLYADVKGLLIRPSLPSDMDYAGINGYFYNNKKYYIRADKSLTAPTLEVQKADDGKTEFHLSVPSDKAYLLSDDDKLTEIKNGD